MDNFPAMGILGILGDNGKFHAFLQLILKSLNSLLAMKFILINNLYTFVICLKLWLLACM